MPDHKSEDYKLSAVQYYLVSYETQNGVCEIFQCSPRSLMRWVQTYTQTGSIERQEKTPIAYKVRKEHVRYILSEIEKDKTITIATLQQLLQQKFPTLDISPVHIWRVLRDNGVTLKMKRVLHEPIKRFGKDINIQDNLKKFYDTIHQHNLDDIICIDETSISALQQRKFCYSQKGTRCVVKTQSQEVFKKYTAIVAISSKGVLGWELYEKGGIDTNRLSAFLTKYITTRYTNKLVILDNASSHRNEEIKKLVNQQNTLVYTVPYQHFTNAIEGYFNILKTRLQKMNGLKYEDLRNNIENAIQTIPLQSYENLLRGAYNRKPFERVPKTRKVVRKVYKE